MTAVDISSHKIDVLSSRLHEEHFPSGAGLDCYHADITLGLPVTGTHFDVALMMGVIEWVALNQAEGDPEAVQRSVLTEIANSLNPGGTLVLGTKNRWYPNYVVYEPQVRKPLINVLPRPMARRFSRLVYRRDYRTYVYSLRGWSQLLRSAGFPHHRSISTHLLLSVSTCLWPVADDKMSLRDALATGVRDVAPEYRAAAERARASMPRRMLLSAISQLGLQRHCWPAFVILARTKP